VFTFVIDIITIFVYQEGKETLSKAVQNERTNEVECGSLLSNSVQQVMHPQNPVASI